MCGSEILRKLLAVSSCSVVANYVDLVTQAYALCIKRQLFVVQSILHSVLEQQCL